MRFTNLNSDFQKPKNSHALRWMLGWHNEKQPKTPSTGIVVPFSHNDGKQLKKGDKDTLTWIGQASFLLQLAGKNILIDPVLSKKIAWIKRNSPPGIDWPAMPKINLVLITHNHRDHMDIPTLKKLGSDPIYLVPKGLGSWFTKNNFHRVIEMGWWQTEDIEGLTITFVPAEHWSRRGLTDINTSWWGGFVIEKNGICLYHSGDTGWFDGFAEIGNRFGHIDIAMLPIGAYAPRWFMKYQHINPIEAIHAMNVLKAKYFVPMHWGTFKLSDEPLDEPPVLLRETWEKANYPDNSLKMAALGQILMLDKMT